MPSPFPGMDPYLESPALWSDLHGALLYAVRGAVTASLPRRYAALVDQYVWLEGPDEDERTPLGAPDVYLADRGTPGVATVTRSVAAAASPYRTIMPYIRKSGHRYLRITDRDRRRLVTVIELLSPANKTTGRARGQYLQKRQSYLATGVSFVEIDLLRAGERMPFGEPPPPPSDYSVVVSREWEFPDAGVWSFSVREPVPVVPIPLSPKDGDVALDIRRCLDQCYDLAEYDRSIDYTIPPDPPLRQPDEDWSRQLLTRRPPAPDTTP